MFSQFILFFFRSIKWLHRKAYISSAIQKGIRIGQNTKFTGSVDFGSEPYLISFGNNCLITDGVRFITHDGSIQVPLINSGISMEDVYSNYSIFGSIKIENNVFIGSSSIILPGTKLGSASIVAAGSVVRGEFPEGVVIGGCPARIICEINEYLERNKSKIIITPKDINREDFIKGLFKTSI